MANPGNPEADVNPDKADVGAVSDGAGEPGSVDAVAPEDGTVSPGPEAADTSDVNVNVDEVDTEEVEEEADDEAAPGPAPDDTEPEVETPEPAPTPEPEEPGVFERLKKSVAKKIDKVLDTATNVAVPVLKYVGGGASFLAEFLGPTTLWLPKVALVGAGYGLDKLGSRHPGSRACRLAKALGEGAWKGGAFGGLAGVAVNLALPHRVDQVMHLPGGSVELKTAPTDVLREQFRSFLEGTGTALGQMINQAKEFTGMVKAKGLAAVPERLDQALPGMGVKEGIEKGAGFVSTQTGEVVGQVKDQVVQLAPEVEQYSRAALDQAKDAGQAGLDLAVQGKEQLADFLKTPLGRVVGAVGLGALTHKLLKAVGFYKEKPAGN